MVEIMTLIEATLALETAGYSVLWKNKRRRIHVYVPNGGHVATFTGRADQSDIDRLITNLQHNINTIPAKSVP